MLKIKNISIAFKDKQVLDDLSLEAHEGEIIGLVAPNGMGKTTLFNVIANFVKPNTGQVVFFGEHTYRSEKEELKIHRQLTVLPEQKDLFGELSGVDHLKLYGNMWKGTAKHIPQIIDDLQMGHYVKQKVRTYSLGMRQRLCFGMMLAADTKIMLMDEVMNGLDISNVALITDQLHRLRANKKLIFIASHLLENLDLYADRVLFLKDRKIIYEQRLNEERDLYLKVSLSREQYEKVKDVYKLPEDHLYIANRVLCIPFAQMDGEERSLWMERLMTYAYQSLTVGPLGTYEYYERYYLDEE